MVAASKVMGDFMIRKMSTLGTALAVSAFGSLVNAAEVRMQLTGKLQSSPTIYSGSMTVDPGTTVWFTLNVSVTDRTGTTGQLAYCTYDVDVTGGDYTFQVTGPQFLAFRGQVPVAGQWFAIGDIDKSGQMSSGDWIPFLKAYDALLIDDDPSSDLNFDFIVDAADAVLLRTYFGGAGLFAEPGPGRFEHIVSLEAAEWKPGLLTLQPFHITMPANAAPGTLLRIVVTPDEALIGNNGMLSESGIPLSLVPAQIFAGASFEMIVPGGVCVGDLTNDGQVDDSDFVGFVFAYNLLDCMDSQMAAGCPADFDSSGLVDDGDFVIFVAAYNALVCP